MKLLQPACHSTLARLLLAVVLTIAGARTAFPAITEVALPTNDIIYDRFSQQIFATVPSTAGALRGNSVTPINPTNGALGTSVFVGSEPGRLAVSDNGQYLYFALNGASAVRRFDIATSTPGLQFTLGNNSFGPNWPDDIDVMPGNADTVAVSLRNSCCSPRHEGVAIFVNGVKLPSQTPGHTGSDVIEFSNTPSVLYGYNNETTEFGFRTMSVNASGVSTTSTVPGLISGFGVDIEYANGRIYSTTGRVIDPAASSLLGTFPASGSVAPDPAAGQVYFLSGNKIQSFNINTFVPIWDLTIPNVLGNPIHLLRFGNNGLAFRTDANQVFLITDPRIGAVPEPNVLLGMAMAGALLLCRRARFHGTTIA